MLKLSHFSGQSELGPTVVPLFGPADGFFEKIASATLMSDVSRYIASLRPSSESQYVLVNAMGAGEYYGSNINGDHFPEASLIHRPDDWTGNPLLDKSKAKTWPYGFPTFYDAHPYAHHRNKDASRAYGEIELACWNPRMKRVELVTRVDKNKCEKFGGTGIWDKLKNGDYPDVSMGSKVPYDTCSICLDWDKYHQALQTFDPKRHKHPGQAVLEYHKSGKKIRGLSITRADYCDHASRMMNRIFPDGRKSFVYNDFPRFFDISFVFIGADKTAKVMLFIFQGGELYSAKPSAKVAEEMGVRPADDDQQKVASVSDELLKNAFGKLAKNKNGEMDKRVVPSQFAGKAVPVLTKNEPDLPKSLLDLMGGLPLEKSLATTTGMGIVLKPREFQRIALLQIGMGDFADDLDRDGKTFSKSDKSEDVKLDPSDFMPGLARLLLPMFLGRSALGPAVERRVVLSSEDREGKAKEASSHNSALLRKIGSIYNGYRSAVMDLVAHSPVLLASAARSGDEMHKAASAEVNELFTPLTVEYLQKAYFNELPFGDTGSGVIQPSETGTAPAWRGASPQ